MVKYTAYFVAAVAVGVWVWSVALTLDSHPWVRVPPEAVRIANGQGASASKLDGAQIYVNPYAVERRYERVRPYSTIALLVAFLMLSFAKRSD